MPSPLIVALKLVPWGDVVANAPKLAEGAKKLWQTMARKPAAPASSEAGATLPPTALPVGTRMAALEAAVTALQQDIAASAGLVASLAEQNAQLVQAVAALRRRIRWLAAALAVVFLVATAALAAGLSP